MLSKNNIKEHIRRMQRQTKKDCFSIRKLTVGTASVLLGFVFFGLNAGTPVKADVIKPNNEHTAVVTDTNKNESNANKGAEIKSDDKVTASDKTLAKTSDNTSSTQVSSAKDTSKTAETAYIADSNNDNSHTSTNTTNNTSVSDDSNDSAVAKSDNNDQTTVATNETIVSSNQVVATEVNGNVTYDEATHTVTMTQGTINRDWQKNVNITGDIDHINITGKVAVQDGKAQFLFYNLKQLQDIRGLENLDTSNMVDTSFMFQNDVNLTSLDVSHFDMSHVINANNMFYNDTKLATITGLNNWHTDSLTNTSYMFAFDSALTNLDLSNFNMSHVTNMSNMFNSDIGLTTLNVANWDTSDVIDMGYVFSNNNKLRNLDISNWNTDKVTNMSNMFIADNLPTLNITKWNTSNVTDMSHMFELFTTPTLNLSNLDTRNVTNMNQMMDNVIARTIILGPNTIFTNRTDKQGNNQLAFGSSNVFSTLPTGKLYSDRFTQVTVDDGQAHPGTYQNYTSSTKIGLYDTLSNPMAISKTIYGYADKPLLMSNSEDKQFILATVKDLIPKHYHVLTADDNDDSVSQMKELDFTEPINHLIVIGDPESNVTIQFVDSKTQKSLGDKVTMPTKPYNYSVLLYPGYDDYFMKLHCPTGYVYDIMANSKLHNNKPFKVTYTDQPQNFTVYVIGQWETSIDIQYYDSTTGKAIGSRLATPAHNYNDTIILNADSPYIKDSMPMGYHYDTSHSQTTNATYTNSLQVIPIYIAKDESPVNPVNPNTPNTPNEPTSNNGNGNNISNMSGINSKKPVPQAVPEPDKLENAKEENLLHNAYLYDKNGKRANGIILKAGSIVDTYGSTLIAGRKFFKLENDLYIASGNFNSNFKTLKHNAYIYNKHGKRIGKAKIKKGKSLATYGSPVKIHGKKYYLVGKGKYVKFNNFTKVKITKKSSSSKTSFTRGATDKNLLHNAYLYDKNGQRANKLILKAGSVVKANTTESINGHAFYSIDDNYYVAQGNINGSAKVLTHNAYQYNKHGKRVGKKVFKASKIVNTYGDPVSIHGKRYYIVGSNRYIKRANFKSR